MVDKWPGLVDAKRKVPSRVAPRGLKQVREALTTRIMRRFWIFASSLCVFTFACVPVQRTQTPGPASRTQDTKAAAEGNDTSAQAHPRTATSPGPTATPAGHPLAPGPATDDGPEQRGASSSLAVRTGGDLTVSTPPQSPTEFEGLRLRTHVEGPLSMGSPRVWVGPPVPPFVALVEDTMELFILDPVSDGFLAFYREPYGAGQCTPGGVDNCRYFARLYDAQGASVWSAQLDVLLSAPKHLEIQDIRYVDGVLYFNEACQSYSRAAKGKCSALVAYDPIERKVLWRTKNLVSNNQFLVHGGYIVTGYGFTAEKDFLYVVSRANGAVMQKVAVASAPQQFRIPIDSVLQVTLYSGDVRLFELRRWDMAKPMLQPMMGNPVYREGPSIRTTSVVH